MPAILDQALETMRARASTIMLLAVAIVLPLSVVVQVLQIQSVGLDSVGDPLSGIDGEGNIDSLLLVTAVLMSSLQVTLMAGALAPLVVEGDTGATAAELAGGLLRRMPAVLLGWMLVKGLEALGLLGLIVGALFMMFFCVLVTPVIVCERVNPFRAIGRSFHLVGRQFGRVVGVVTLTVVVDSALRLSIIGLPAVITAWTSWAVGPTVVAVLTVASDMFSASFVGLATAVLYLDVRVRSEHLDLQRRFEQHGVSW